MNNHSYLDKVLLTNTEYHTEKQRMPYCRHTISNYKEWEGLPKEKRLANRMVARLANFFFLESEIFDYSLLKQKLSNSWGKLA